MSHGVVVGVEENVCKSLGGNQAGSQVLVDVATVVIPVITVIPICGQCCIFKPFSSFTLRFAGPCAQSGAKCHQWSLEFWRGSAWGLLPARQDPALCWSQLWPFDE